MFDRRANDHFRFGEFDLVLPSQIVSVTFSERVGFLVRAYGFKCLTINLPFVGFCKRMAG
jgi:hypothetical protein